MAPVLVAFCACGRFGFDEHGAQAHDSSVAVDVATTPGFCATAVFANPGTSSFADDFTVDPFTSRWDTAAQTCVTQVGGELVASPNGAGEFCHAFTMGDHHLTCDSITVHVAATTRQALGAQTYIYIRSFTNSQDIQLLQEAGGFTGSIEAGSYDAAADAWWRLREQEGTIFFETAPDGLAWAERLRIATPFSLDHVEVGIGAGTYLQVSNPGQARFHCFNVPPPCN
jgi:hypothetical protein